MRNLFGNDNLVAIGHFETLLKVKLSKSNAHSPHSVVACLNPTNTHVVTSKDFPGFCNWKTWKVFSYKGITEVLAQVSKPREGKVGQETNPKDNQLIPNCWTKNICIKRMSQTSDYCIVISSDWAISSRSKYPPRAFSYCRAMAGCPGVAKGFQYQMPKKITHFKLFHNRRNHFSTSKSEDLAI